MLTDDQLDLVWWSLSKVYKCQITVSYNWNLYNILIIKKSPREKDENQWQ